MAEAWKRNIWCCWKRQLNRKMLEYVTGVFVISIFGEVSTFKKLVILHQIKQFLKVWQFVSVVCWYSVWMYTQWPNLTPWPLQDIDPYTFGLSPPTENFSYISGKKRFIFCFTVAWYSLVCWYSPLLYIYILTQGACVTLLYLWDKIPVS